MKPKLVFAALLACANKHKTDKQTEGERAPEGGSAPIPPGESVSPAELAQLRAAASGLDTLAGTITELFPNRIEEGSTVSSIADRIIREHAKKLSEAPPSAELALVEGCSATNVGADEKGVQSVYVIGVSTEKEVACIYAAPPRLIPLKQLRPIKRGHPISASEVTQRNAAYPAIKWDERKDD